MGKLTIVIDTTNDAFHSFFDDMDAYNTQNEISRVLDRASSKLGMIHEDGAVAFVLTDTNGNTCGTMTWEANPDG